MCKLVGQGVYIKNSVMGSKLVIWKEDIVCRKFFSWTYGHVCKSYSKFFL